YQLSTSSAFSGAFSPPGLFGAGSLYDAYLGVMVLVRVIDGVLTKGQTVRMMGNDAKYQVERVGVLTPKMVNIDRLGPGEIGFITASIKEVADTRVGD
ncbi:EF-Tu/IF-2/RF-3 family GTPase, partial [Rhizobium ruizarguesonis]